MIGTLSAWHLAVIILLTVAPLAAIIVTIVTPGMRLADKVFWILFLVLVPVIGLVSWVIWRLVTRGRRAPQP
ncbi:MAG: hypothetical protein ABIO06_03995 [Pseudolysinimonas sp.]